MTEEKELEIWGVVSPGDILEEKLEEMGMDVNEFAQRIGYTPKTVNELLKGKCRVTTEVALNLEYVTEIPASNWLNMQRYYEEDLMRKKMRESLNSKPLWRKDFPLPELAPRNWINDLDNKEDNVSPILRFFKVSSPKAWMDYYLSADLKVAFRISLAEAQDPYAASVWLRRGEILAEAIPMEKQNDKKIRSALKKALPQFIELAKKYGDQSTQGAPGEIDEGMQKLHEFGLTLGVKILYVQNFKSAPIHGMARWYRDIPIIQIHDRFEDRRAFWYTFFHELSHIILHGKKDIFIKNVYHGNKNPQKEEEADLFAQKCMVDAGLEMDAKLRKFVSV
ncbi:HigA family addiction module antitoxin [Fibrobacter sp. UWEL]|uniref:HigA family addiction module antitoxin n=1 Tax=Fibrobacter sp. UWEL TaxID=1896209 RepID=UPI000921AB43|nr:HigA family addiction module antitoxin [Fibrobacter sp. UWEL]SHK61907.1 addiction module antidote protein, HigA family [Fibrobacter sp. UWEL]